MSQPRRRLDKPGISPGISCIGTHNQASCCPRHISLYSYFPFKLLSFGLDNSGSYYADRLKRACLNTFGTTLAEARWARKRKFVGNFLCQHLVRTLKHSSTYPTITYLRVALLVINHSYSIWHRATLFSYAFKPAIHISSQIGIIGVSSTYVFLLERVFIPGTIL